MDLNRDIEHRFTYHPPTSEAQIAVYQRVRNAGLELARVILASSPDSEERKLSLNQVDAAVLWANAAIARRT